MGVYLHAKLEVSSIILTSFRQGVILPPPPTPQIEPLKSTPRLGLKLTLFRLQNYHEFSRFFLCGELHPFADITWTSRTSKVKPNQKIRKEHVTYAF